ncbi:E3 ubiquitin-protein ligase SIS3 [Artemisia annua]|uniref:E3 ubiquitin-protein ligase SIS3 n=1 Tax=Artemisia annua TaxID=35608 RepID=A0A2U1MR68_ARTAN|nr:E3 ubiquitin-protein ligase SIS3 [Artemisia annua]
MIALVISLVIAPVLSQVPPSPPIDESRQEQHWIQRFNDVYILKDVPTDCRDCSICLVEFRVGKEVRGFPCACVNVICTAKTEHMMIPYNQEMMLYMMIHPLN